MHIKRIVDRSPSHAIDYLTEHLVELTGIGMLTLNSKLQGLQDDKLLARLSELWHFFLTKSVLLTCRLGSD